MNRFLGANAVNNVGLSTGNNTSAGFSPQPQPQQQQQQQQISNIQQPLGSSDAGLMQPPRNPAPSTHHKKQADGSSIGSVTISSTTRRRGASVSSSSSIAATVAAVAGGGAGPGPPISSSGTFFYLVLIRQPIHVLFIRLHRWLQLFSNQLLKHYITFLSYIT